MAKERNAKILTSLWVNTQKNPTLARCRLVRHFASGAVPVLWPESKGHPRAMDIEKRLDECEYWMTRLWKKLRTLQHDWGESLSAEAVRDELRREVQFPV